MRAGVCACLCVWGGGRGEGHCWKERRQSCNRQQPCSRAMPVLLQQQQQEADASLLEADGVAARCSPLARVAAWRTGHMPFDRHDWYVDRCGKEVRYVIDFYFNEDKAGTPEVSRCMLRCTLPLLPHSLCIEPNIGLS